MSALKLNSIEDRTDTENAVCKASNPSLAILSNAVAYNVFLSFFFHSLVTSFDKMLVISRETETSPACCTLINALVDASDGGD